MDKLVTRTSRRDLSLALGTAQWSGSYGINNRTGAPEPHVAHEMLTLAQSAGIATIDTARGYGESEALLGNSLRAMRAERHCDDDFHVITKLDPSVSLPGDTAAKALANTGRSLAMSRRALGRDTLDVVLLHRYPHLFAHDGAIWRRLLREKEAGAISALGVSAANPNEAWAALKTPEVEVIQVAASLLDQRLARSGFFEAAREAGKRVYVRSVFLQGVAFIAPSQLPQHLLGFAQPLGKIRGFASALGCEMEQLFLAYAATLPDVTAIVGCESTAQLLGIIEAQKAGLGSSVESVRRLANHIAPLPDRLLDPSQWTRELPAARVVKTARSRASVSTPVPGVG
ncbi:MAG: aryl-alcohol dehydrogenase-like predicted oxidoreductase [Myxococcota bacterium]|jgi:aryl-alcohol dehydrogenase-like predicted oxidoreductase